MDCETVYIMLIVCYEYVISKLKLLLILTSFGESPEGNQNQYASIPEPFPLKSKRKKKDKVNRFVTTQEDDSKQSFV